MPNTTTGAHFRAVRAGSDDMADARPCEKTNDPTPTSICVCARAGERKPDQPCTCARARGEGGRRENPGTTHETRPPIFRLSELARE